MKKVMIITDLEGCSGTEGAPDGALGNRVFNDEKSVNCLTREINACIDGLREGGAEKILVWDLHGGGFNFSANSLCPGVEMCMTHEPLCHVSFLDAGFCAHVILGAHARQGVPDGYLNHTRNSHMVSRIIVNGQEVGESELSMLRAAFYRVPTILVAGDYAACRNALAFHGKPLETVVCKRGFSRYSVMHYPPEKVLAEIREKSCRAIRNLSDYKPLKVEENFEVIYQVFCPNQMVPFIQRGAEMLDGTTVRLRGSDAIDCYAQLCGWNAGIHNRHFHISAQTDSLFE